MPDPSHNPLLIVISGPSGVGKDSLLACLKETGYPFHFVVTVTTRPRRSNEVDGRDYHFISEREFQEMLAQGELLEHATVYGDHKGVPKQQVHDALTSGQDVIMRLDVQGTATVRRLVPEAVTIFVTAASEAELFDRLRARETETPDSLKLRLETARQELDRIDEFDYVVINRPYALEQAVQDVMSIVRAEHCRARPRKVTL
jgi:guanylate kinase